MKHAGICPAVSAVQSCWWGSWCFIMGLLATLLPGLEPNCKLIKKGMTVAKSPRLWKREVLQVPALRTRSHLS